MTQKSTNFYMCSAFDQLKLKIVQIQTDSNTPDQGKIRLGASEAFRYKLATPFE